MIVAVTGASGMLGRHLCDHFTGRGWQVRALVRDPVAFGRLRPDISSARCELPGAVDEGVLAGADAVVHAAYPTRLTDLDRIRSENEDGTRRLLEASRRAGVGRFVFISSIVAASDAPSYYARSKYALEALVDHGRDAIVRPGLILAREGQGLFQQMRDAMVRTHVLPVFGGGKQPLQTVHVDDVCEAIARVIERALVGGFNVAEAEPFSMAGFLRLLARRLRTRCVLVPLPLAPTLAAVRVFERLGVPFPLRSESILGIKALRRVPVVDDLRRLDLRVRSADESLATLL